MTRNGLRRLPTWLVCGTLLLISGCTKYENASAVAYDYAKAIYSITNQRAADRLDQISQQLEQASADGRLNDKEFRWLSQMIADARQGDWDVANSASRRLLEDQVQY